VVVVLADERRVAARRVIEIHRVRNDEARIDLAVLDALEQRLHVALHVALTGLHRGRPVHERTHREPVDQAAVYADHRDLKRMAPCSVIEPFSRESSCAHMMSTAVTASTFAVPKSTPALFVFRDHGGHA
jgi:hypothetical protein